MSTREMEVSLVLVVATNIVRKEPFQVPLIEHQHVVEQVPTGAQDLREEP